MKPQEALQFLCSLAEGIAAMFGELCETLVQEYKDGDMTVLAIYNGHVSGRKAGSREGILGGQLNIKDQRIEELTSLNQMVLHPSGKKIKSSSFLMKGEEFAYILGINYDVTLLERMEGFLGGFLSCQGNLYETMRENGAGTLDTIYDSCAEMMPDIEGKLSRERRQTLIRLLDSQQFFKLQKSIPYLSEKLKVSKYTLYKDMDDLHLR